MVTLHGLIDRRIVLNYTAESDFLNDAVPQPLKAVEVDDGVGVGQVSLMRHRVSVHPKVPSALRLPAETASHRIPVVRDEDGGTGMYVLRRDTDSELGRVAGRIFSVREQGKAEFQTREFRNRGEYSVQMEGKNAFVSVDAHETGSVNDSVFGSLEAADEFQRGEERSIEVSDDGFVGSRFSVQGELKPLETVEARSTVFEDIDAGFDSAFVSKGRYEWEPDAEKPEMLN
jgi:hypothetical protein